MSFAATNYAVWKQVAEEKADAARTMGRIALGLFVACNVLAATAFSAHSNYSSMCSFVDERQQADVYGDDEVTKVLKTDFCS
jgi:hypothetical protein